MNDSEQVRISQRVARAALSTPPSGRGTEQDAMDALVRAYGRALDSERIHTQFWKNMTLTATVACVFLLGVVVLLAVAMGWR